jgi:hypothetical protein
MPATPAIRIWRRFYCPDDLLHFMTVGALHGIALEPAGYRKGCRDELHLLAPLQS